MDNKDEKSNFHDLRINYQNTPLVESNLPSSPIKFFQDWFDQAILAGEIEPNGMVFSTLQETRLRSRVVLLKEIDGQQFIFYTGLSSDKGQEMLKHPTGSFNFWWRVLHRQVRIEGKLSLVSAQKNQEYFSSRPRASQLAVLAQKQTKVISSRDDLLKKYKETEDKYAGQEKLKCPDDWGGIALTPDYLEFWQGQPNRLHDRIIFEKNVSSNQTPEWKIYRLSP